MQIIFSDIDGTLLNQEHQVTPATARAIKACVDKGLYFVPVSARMPEAIRPIIDEIGIPSPIIAYNGALIQAQDGTVVDSKIMAMPEVLSVCHTIEKLGQDLAWNIYSYKAWYSSQQAHNLVHNEEVVVGLKSQIADLDQLASLKEAHKVLVMCPPERTEQVLQALKED
ncbi:HAD-IIB family hydrolase, partial [Streptococcus sobrinus]